MKCICFPRGKILKVQHLQKWFGRESRWRIGQAFNVWSPPKNASKTNIEVKNLPFQCNLPCDPVMILNYRSSIYHIICTGTLQTRCGGQMTVQVISITSTVIIYSAPTPTMQIIWRDKSSLWQKKKKNLNFPSTRAPPSKYHKHFSDIEHPLQCQQ